MTVWAIEPLKAVWAAVRSASGFSAEDIFSQFGDIFGGLLVGWLVVSSVNAVVQTCVM